MVFVLLVGCLGTTWRVPREELDRLAAQDPPARGDAVRAVQDLEWAAVPPRSEAPRPEPIERHAVDVDVPRPVGFFVGIGVSVPLPVPGPPLLLPPPPPRPPVPPPIDGAPAGNPFDDVDDARALAVLAILAAAGVLVVVGTTEGMRFDGWVGVDPDQPLHLRDEAGWRTLPVRELRPEDLDGVRYAVLRPDEGDVAELARAPLDRTGLTYRVELGAGELPGTAWGPDAHILAGWYPSRWVGVLGGTQLGWDAPGSDEQVRTRLGAEVELLPFSGGRFHMGGFAGGGWEWATTTGGRTEAPYVAAGVLGELELVTRLGLTARVGWAVDPRAPEPNVYGALGLSVY